MATSWTITHGLMLLWFTDLMKVTEEVTIHRPSSIFKDATMMRTRTFKRLLFFRNLKKINKHKKLLKPKLKRLISSLEKTLNDTHI